MKLPFFTVGHSTRHLDEFVLLLAAADVRLVADVRKMTRSRANPQINEDVLPAALTAAGVGYEHVAARGGRRDKSRSMPPPVNGYWTHPSFQNYADHALSADFRAGLDHLVELGRSRPVAVMCSEAVWWRCHRQIVADYLLARGETVSHIMAENRSEPARLTPGAVVRSDGTVTYPSESSRLSTLN